MRLIVEKMNGEFYVYKETEKHFKVVEPKRGKLSKTKLTRVDPEVLKYECNTSLNDNIPHDNWYMVFNFKENALPQM